MWYVFVDVIEFYRNTGIQRDKCILVAVHMIPTKFMGNYELHKLLHNGHSYKDVFVSLHASITLEVFCIH